MAEILVVQSKVKDYIKGKGCNTSGTAVDALSKAVADLLNKAIDRCKANGRKTVTEKDI
ncbi:MAG: NFYB/HAP3 family transcription factor subunit [Deltaproteobacteria bacterium]|nr:NFYB/HAP3 family transcription factor subunit [Deltaproteobacteria bacterium]